MSTTAPQTPGQWAYAWIAALRSGRYSQTTGVLNDGRGNLCALGVFCDVAVRHGEARWAPDGHAVAAVTTEHASLVGLPAPLPALLGLPAYTGWAGPPLGPGVGVGTAEVGVLNDAGHGFGEIADRLEAWATEAGLFDATEADGGREHGDHDLHVGVLPVPGLAPARPDATVTEAEDGLAGRGLDPGDGILRRPLAGGAAAGLGVTETGDPDGRGDRADRAGVVGGGPAGLTGAGVGRGPAGLR